jgi:hypothetical protein
MGKLKKNSKLNSKNGFEEHENGLDWEQLLTGYQNQSVDEILANLMNKVIFKKICIELYLKKVQKKLLCKRR